MNDLVWRSATDLAGAIAAREVAAREVVDACLAQLDAVNPSLNAVVTADADGARAAAAAADEAVAGGRPLGPLHGVPVTLKDNLEVAGMRSTGGDPGLADHRPGRDSDVAARLRAAGAVVLGKTNLPTYGNGHETANPVFGVTANPWDQSRTPGGSSGGSAVAVAVGIAALDVGGDNAGSIRIPASWCGTFGLAPSPGLISQRGVLGASRRFGVGEPPRDLGVLGPLARTALDLDLALRVLAGPDDRVGVAWRLELPPPADRPLAALRIATWLDEPAFPTDAAVRQLLEAAVDRLADTGASPVPARPELDPVAAHDVYWTMLLAADAHLIDEHGYRRATKGAERFPDAEGYLASGARAFATSHRAWLEQVVERRRIEDRWATFFADHDVLLCPATPVAAIPHDPEPGLVSDFEHRCARTITVDGEERPLYDLAFWPGLTVLAGLPAAVVPAGRTPEGLPVGIQVVGRRYADREVVRVAGLLGELLGGFVPPPLVTSASERTSA